MLHGGWEKLVVIDLRIGRINHGRQSEEIFYVGKSLMERGSGGHVQHCAC